MYLSARRLSIKVAILNALERGGGAARCAGMLADALKERGVDALLAVKFSNNPRRDLLSCRGNRLMDKWLCSADKLPLKLFHRNTVKASFSLNWFPSNTRTKVMATQPDIVHLHWINQGFLSMASLAHMPLPLVWTLHDTWAFTGGCHIPRDCRGYLATCGHCPLLKSTSPFDMSRWAHRRKQKAFKAIKQQLTIVAPSTWLADCARKSSLLKDTDIEVIANGVDHRVFRPVPKPLAKRMLGLPPDRKLIMFGAMGALADSNKGNYLLSDALQRLRGELADTELVIFGTDQPAAPTDYGLPVRYAGTISDDAVLALHYAAAEVVVVPSVQENLPYVALEAMACGTPVVAFAVGGIPEVIDSGLNGYLAQSLDVSDLGRGIHWVLNCTGETYAQLSGKAHDKITSCFSLDKHAAQHLKLYDRILG